MSIAENINSAIDTLCEKFGVAWGEAAKLVPELIRYGRVESILLLLLSVIALVTGAAIVIWTCRICLKRRAARKKERIDSPETIYWYLDYGTDLSGYNAIGWAFLIGGGIATPFAAAYALRWALAPNIAVIQYIISMVESL